MYQGGVTNMWKLIVLIFNRHVLVFFLWVTKKVFAVVFNSRKSGKYFQSYNSLKKKEKNHLFEMSQH